MEAQGKVLPHQCPYNGTAASVLSTNCLSIGVRVKIGFSACFKKQWQLQAAAKLKGILDPVFTLATKPWDLIAKQEESKEKTIEVSCQDAQVDRSGTSDFNHQWHEAVQAKHTEGKCYKQ